MAIIAALITASVALLVPFITFYLNKAPTVANGTKSAQIDVPVTISPNGRLLILIPLALVFCVPVGFVAFCVAVVGNIFFTAASEVFLFSLDAGLCSAAILAMSLVFHAGLNEPRKWWSKLKWYQLMVLVFFSALGYVTALISNTIWALAHGTNPIEVHVFYDSIDAAALSGIVAWGAAYATVKIEELRDPQSKNETARHETTPVQSIGSSQAA